MSALNQHHIITPLFGMFVKKKINLTIGETYVHFAHRLVDGRRQSQDIIRGGEWWIELKTYEKLKERASRTGLRLSQVARHELAIAQQWRGSLDIVVQAKLKHSLVAFIGAGIPQDLREIPRTPKQTFAESLRLSNKREKPTQRVWVPSPDPIQLYIPNLRKINPITGNFIYKDAFIGMTQSPIW